VLSLGLITFSCFDQTTPPIILLSYILLFFIIWIIALRGISLSKDIKEIKEVLRPQKWLYRELKVGIVFLLLLIFLVIPIYLFIPHFNISVPFLPRFVEQKYAITYADFPRNRMLSFLSRSPEKLANKEKISASKRGEKSELGLIEFPKVKKQVFWHSPQEYKNNLQELERKIEEIQTEITKIDKELQEISQEEKIPEVKESIEERKRLTERYKALAKNREQLQEQQAHLKEEYLKAIQEKSVASINEPENKELLKSLEEKIKTKESNLENITKNLKTLKEELNRISETIDEVRATVYRQSMKSDKGSQIQKAWAKKENLEERLETLKEEIQTVQKEYNRIIYELTAQKTQEELEKKEEKKEEFSLFDLLIRILILVIFSILLFLIYCVIAFFFPYLREKNKFKKTSRQLKYKLAMVLLYNFLCRILNIFGYRYPVIIDPEEYSVKVIRDFKNLRSDVNLITTLFLEARYSTHTIIKEQVETALNSYKNILKELKNTGSFWRKIILRLDFVFKL